MGVRIRHNETHRKLEQHRVGEKMRECSGGGQINLSIIHLQVKYQEQNPTEQ
jgi:hypothetical protein